MTVLNSTLLMSSARHFGNDHKLNPYYQDGATVDTAKAQAEHAGIREALRAAGAEVVTVEAPPTSQDGVYTANWALVRDGRALMATLPPSRQSEEAWARDRLAELGYQIDHLPLPWRFSGQGDALVCGDLVFCGAGYRSDEAALEYAAQHFGLERIQLQTLPLLNDDGTPHINAASGWPDSYWYDIDLTLAVLREPDSTGRGLIAYCPEAFTVQSRAILAELDTVDTIEIAESEARQSFACNLVSTGTTVVMSDSAPQLRADVESAGLSVITPHVDELAKGGGYIRCTSLWI
jgi:N-dimethylarginine dimethylaminohydrolase